MFQEDAFALFIKKQMLKHLRQNINVDLLFIEGYGTSFYCRVE